MELVDVIHLKVAGMAFEALMGGEVGGALDTSEGEALVFRVQCDRDSWLWIFGRWILGRDSFAILGVDEQYVVDNECSLTNRTAVWTRIDEIMPAQMVSQFPSSFSCFWALFPPQALTSPLAQGTNIAVL